MRLSASRARRRAVTLVELFVVISIISVLLSITTGVYFAFLRTSALMAETHAVAAIIQTAQGTAVSDGAETFVFIDTKENQLYPFGRQKVAVWHLESLYGVTVNGGQGRLTDGKIGRALDCDGAFWLTAPSDPAGETREGVSIEAFVAPAPSGTEPMTLVARDRWFGLWLRYDEPLKKFRVSAMAVMLNPDGTGYQSHSATTAPVLRPDEWAHVSMNCHRLGTGVVIRVNGVEQTPETSESGAVGAPPQDAKIGLAATASGAEPFHGRLDEVILGAYMVDRVHRVSKRVSLEAENLADGNTIRFDGTGRLSSVHDGAPPRIIIHEMTRTDSGSTARARSTATITIGSMGALDVAFTHDH